MNRPFFLPALGMTLVFAFAGPAVGAVVFLPVAFWLAAPPAVAATAHMGWLVAVFGHLLTLIPAYFVGIAPAAAAGLLFAIWDWAVPARFPRALAAAVIGAAMAHALATWIASLGAGVEASVATSSEAADWIDDIFSPEFTQALRHALETSGAIAGFACAMLASLLGLTASEPVSAAAKRASVIDRPQ